jgi:hypothetical protein
MAITSTIDGKELQQHLDKLVIWEGKCNLNMCSIKNLNMHVIKCLRTCLMLSVYIPSTVAVLHDYKLQYLVTMSLPSIVQKCDIDMKRQI